MIRIQKFYDTYIDGLSTPTSPKEEQTNDAIEFAEWIAENQYTHFGFPTAHKWMCEKEGDDNTYTTQELYTLFLNTKNK